MTTEELHEKITALRNEGFGEVYVCDDQSGKIYPPHQHDYRSVHWIVAGKMDITIDGRTETLNVGQRSDVGAGVSHQVNIGSEGCMFIIAEDHIAT